MVGDVLSVNVMREGRKESRSKAEGKDVASVPAERGLAAGGPSWAPSSRAMRHPLGPSARPGLSSQGSIECAGIRIEL